MPRATGQSKWARTPKSNSTGRFSFHCRVSQVLTFSTKSIATSVQSSSSEKARAAAKQAALEAKANTLHKLHELQLEELKIKQKHSEVKLQAEIAAAEAEKQVYEQSEASVIPSNRSVCSRNMPENSVVQQVPVNKSGSPQPTAHAAVVNQQQTEPSTSQEQNPSAQWLPNQTPFLMTTHFNG